MYPHYFTGRNTLASYIVHFSILLQNVHELPRSQVTVGVGAPLALQTSRKLVPMTTVLL